MREAIHQRIRELETFVLEKKGQIIAIHKDFDHGRFDSYQRDQRIKECEHQIQTSIAEIADLRDQLDRGETVEDYSVKRTFRGKTGTETYELFRDVMHQAFETLKVVTNGHIPTLQFVQNVEEISRAPEYVNNEQLSGYSDPEPFDPWLNVEHTYSWFNSELKSQEERVFIITLAMFGGIPQKELLTVFDQIKGRLNVFSVYAATNAFQSRIADLMEIADATFVEYPRFTNAGVVKTTAINFRDGRAAALILLMLCRFYHENEVPKLLHFLAQVALTNNSSVLRERAAIALGMLGQIEFEWIQSPYLNDWAKQPKGMMISRHVVSIILSSVYQPSGRYNDNVFTLVKHWASMPWNFRLWLTAAICCSRLGVVSLDKTIPILGQLIAHDHIDLIDPLIYSISNIFQKLDEDQVVRLLHQFRNWITSGTDTLQVGSTLVIIGWMNITLRRDFRRLLLPALERGQEIDFWTLPVEYNGKNARAFRQDYVYTLSAIFAGGLSLSPVIAREINLLLREFVVVAELRIKYRPLVRDVCTDLCCNVSIAYQLRQYVFDSLATLKNSPKGQNLIFLGQLVKRIQERFDT